MVVGFSSGDKLTLPLFRSLCDEIHKFRCLSVQEIGSNNPTARPSTLFEYPITSQQDSSLIHHYKTDWPKSATLRKPFANAHDTFLRNLMETRTVVILGELSVGKSALCQNFFHTGIKQRLDGKHDAKNFDQEEIDDEKLFTAFAEEVTQKHHVYERPVEVNGNYCRISILDVNTEKQILESSHVDGFGDIDPLLKSGEGYIVAYAVTDKGTFRTAQDLLLKITQRNSTHSTNSPIILVGNKCDLVRKRQVSTEEGIKMAEKFGIKFVETSASLNQNVNQLFEGIIHQIRLREAQNIEEINLVNSKKYQEITTAIPQSFNKIKVRDGEAISEGILEGCNESCRSKSSSLSYASEETATKRKKNFFSRCKLRFMKRKQKSSSCASTCLNLSVL